MGRARRVERAVRVPILGRIAYDLDLEGDILSSRPSLEKATSRRFSLSEPGATRLIDEQDTLSFGDLTFRIFHIPGHCPGSIVLVDDAHKLAFVGDVIFSGSVGRTDFPGCSFDKLLQGIQTKLFTLEDGFKLLPGHGPATTVGKERRSNPFVADLPASNQDAPEMA